MVTEHPDVQALLNEVQTHYDHPIKIEISGPASGVLTHTQSQQELRPDGTLAIVITDTTNVDYTLSHELLHLWLQMKGFMTPSFDLASGDPSIDEQRFATSTALFQAVVHAPVLAWQQAHGLLDLTVLTQVQAGFDDMVIPETDGRPEMFIFRVLSLLDLLNFYVETPIPTSLAHAYPEALPVAQQLHEIIISGQLDTPWGFRRALVRLLRQFDQQIEKAGYQPTDNPEFVSLMPVLSSRQLRLGLNQVYTLKHSEMLDRHTKKPAYIALGLSDEQNAFVLPLPQQKTTPEAFQQLYQEPLADILARYQIAYQVR